MNQPSAAPSPASGASGKAPGPALSEFVRSLPGLRENPLQFVQDAADRYGDIVHYRLGGLNGFLLNRPEAIQHVLQDNNRNYSKETFQYAALARVTGQGLLTSDGNAWLSHRRLMQPAFHRQRLAGFGPLMVETTHSLLQAWEEPAAQGQVVDVDQAMMRLALEILGKALLGVDLSRQAPALTGAVLAVLDHIVGQVKSPPGIPAFIPTPANRQFRSAMRILERAVYEIIAAHQGGEMKDADDLLSNLIRAREDGGKSALDSRALRDEVITLLIAGHETVASALTWACCLLAQNPGAAGLMQLELDRVLQGRSPGVEDLPRLDYTRRVFDETLRLYPPAWIITRKCLGADRICGYEIPPGSLMVIGVSAMHHHPAYWPDPQQFVPDRFIPEASAGRPRFAYLPFGGGPRLCIGNSFALTEAPLILAAIFQRYRLELAPGAAVEALPLVTLRPRHGLPMLIKKK
jgi:cytochrome P450